MNLNADQLIIWWRVCNQHEWTWYTSGFCLRLSAASLSLLGENRRAPPQKKKSINYIDYGGKMKIVYSGRFLPEQRTALWLRDHFWRGRATLSFYENVFFLFHILIWTLWIWRLRPGDPPLPRPTTPSLTFFHFTLWNNDLVSVSCCFFFFLFLFQTRETSLFKCPLQTLCQRIKLTDPPPHIVSIVY